MTRRRTLVLIFLAAFARAAAGDIAFKLTDSKGAPVADAVVSLIPLDTPAKIAPSTQPVEIAQSGQEFSTFVTPIVVGTTVVFPNRDNCGHQVYSLSPPKKFALPLYKPGPGGTVVFDRPGVVALGCNIHDWMLAYIVVLETPFFAKTGSDGTAAIAAPPGRYRAEVWHPRLAKPELRELTVAADGSPTSVAFAVTLKPERRIRRTPGNAAGGYK